MTSAAPPLWTWGAALTLSLIILGAAAMDPAGKVDPVAELNLERLTAARSAGAPVVAIVGTSKAQCAIAFDPDFTARVRAAGSPATIVRISRLGGVYQDFEPALRRLAAEPPSVVLIEEDLLLYSPPREPLPEEVSWRARALRAVRTHLGAARRNTNFAGDDHGLCDHPAADADALVADYVANWAKQPASTAHDRERYRHWIEQLRATGVTVALIEVPRSPLAARHLPAPVAASSAATLNELQTTWGLTRLSPPFQLPQGAYSDLGHMDPDGRRDYSAWLASQIAAMIRDG